MKKLFFAILSMVFLLPQLANAQACIEPTSEEGVQLIGFIQPQYEYNFLGNDVLGESQDESSYYFNRARLGVAGNIPYDFSYYALMEFSPTLNGSRESRAPFLLDAFITYNRFAPYAKVSVGQFKSPFGLEAMTACHKLYTIRRSDVVINTQGLFRDQGLMISGSTGNLSLLGSKTENLFSYNFAVMNGAGLNQFDVDNNKDIVARLAVHPFDFITLAASYRTGKRPPQDATIKEEDTRRRLGFDAELKFNKLLLQGEFIRAEDIGSYTTGGGCSGDLEVHEGTLTRNGFFVQAAYMTPWNLQPVIRLEEYLVPQNNNEQLWEGNLMDGLFGETNDQAFNTVTYGLNYFFNEWTRLQVNYLYRAEKGSLTEINNDALLVQMQVVF